MPVLLLPHRARCDHGQPAPSQALFDGNLTLGKDARCPPQQGCRQGAYLGDQGGQPVQGQRANRKFPKVRHMVAGVAATTAGVAGFLAIGQPSGGRTQVSRGILPPLAIGIVVVTGGCLAVAARNRNLRSLVLALACGVNYGAAAFLIKQLTWEFGGGPGQVFTNWPIYIFAVVGPAGYILNQDAFQQGTLLAPVQAIISAADPVISIALGIGWLAVRLRGGPADIAGEVVSLMLLTAGIVMTAYHVPTELPGGPVSIMPGRGAGPRC